MQYPLLDFVLPIIVTTGPVLTVDVTSDEPVVNTVNWARLKRTFRSKELSRDFRVDVVSFEHFEEYVSARILAIVRRAKEILSTNIHLYDPQWLISNLGEPEEKVLFRAWFNAVRTTKGD
jgi:hypothetical protein